MPKYTLKVNETERAVEVRDPAEPLLFVLRNQLGLTGAKYGCGLGQCGACTVLINGEATRSCLVPVSAGNRQVDHDDRAPVGSIAKPEPAATGVHRTAGGTVRLLCPRDGDERNGAAWKEREADA